MNYVYYIYISQNSFQPASMFYHLSTGIIMHSIPRMGYFYICTIYGVYYYVHAYTWIYNDIYLKKVVHVAIQGKVLIIYTKQIHWQQLPKYVVLG